MSEGAPHEIVIIKRGGGDHEDGHHGGAWKIAFADFMTAMMAFFLVMWLISANDKTKAVIARYFNPVQLVDATPQPKGLDDPRPDLPSVMRKSGGGAAKAEEAQKAPEDKAEAKAEGAAPKEKAEAKPEKAGAKPEDAKPAEAKGAEASAKAAKEGQLFKDPYAILAEIAGNNNEQPLRDKAKAETEGAKGGAGAIGLKGGEAYRDPFEPLPMPQGTPEERASVAEILAARPAPEARPKSPPAPPPAEPQPTPASGKTASEPAKPATDAQDTPSPASPATPAPPVSVAADKASAALAAKLEAAIKGANLGNSTPGLPKLEVHHTAEGTLIDLTDGPSFAMFNSGSAEPVQKMVRLMEKVGRVIKGEKGMVTVRGFTDNRPFRSESYDNWRLSAARAHMAHYMLVRGGIDEQRFERIEGYADRQPKNAKDPGGAENRRIEILIRDATP